MAGKAVAITLIVALAAFIPLTWLAFLIDGSWETTSIIAAVMDLILSVTIMGGFIISAIEKSAAARTDKTQDSADSTK
ncbi:MAG: hypothetical protein IJB04_03750 [Oscillospiraceae bacterium]|nr:hypothetical protein [Oscillospiraceae bacterium]